MSELLHEHRGMKRVLRMNSEDHVIVDKTDVKTALERIAALESELSKAREPRVCVWERTGFGSWKVQCADDAYRTLRNGDFCHRCGGRIEIKEVAP